MNKEKQIEEMANELATLMLRDRNLMSVCAKFYNAGYRKASELIEEIEKYILEGATTIESNNSDSLYGAKFAIEKVVLPILEAYKNKYTESEKDDE